MRKRTNFLISPEELDLFRNEPELLIIADAYSVTQRPVARLRHQLSAADLRRPAIIAVALLALISITALPVLVADAPGIKLTDRALAAVGAGPVLHSIVLTDVPGQTLLDLSSHSEKPSILVQECWSDEERRILRCVTERDGVLQDTQLALGNEAYSSAGPIDTGGRRLQPDQALAAFADRYRSALESGRAREEGRGVLHGTRVIWLKFESELQFSERVAVALNTFEPLAYRWVGPGGEQGPLWDVTEIESLGREAVPGLASPLASTQPPSIGRVTNSRPADVEAAMDALEGKLVLPKGDMELLRVEVQRLETGYGTGTAPVVDAGVVLTYSFGRGQAEDDRSADVTIRESRSPQLAYRFPTTSTGMESLVPSGYALVEPVGNGFTAFLGRDATYLSISGVRKSDVVATVRALARR